MLCQGDRKACVDLEATSVVPAVTLLGSEAAHGGDQLGRTTLVFETAFPKYAWLNRIVPVAGGRREASGPVYEVHEVL